MNKLNPQPDFYDNKILVFFGAGRWQEYSSPVCVIPMSIMTAEGETEFKNKLIRLFNEYSIMANLKFARFVDEPEFALEKLDKYQEIDNK